MSTTFHYEMAMSFLGLLVAIVVAGCTLTGPGVFERWFDGLFMAGFTNYKSLALYTMVILKVITTYLHLRQHETYSVTRKPDESKLDKKEFLKAQEYGAAKSTFSLYSSLYDFVLEFAVLSLDVVPRVWAWSCAALRDAELHDADSSHWWLSNDVREALFFVYAFTLFTTVHNLPFTYYSTFVIEERFGFNKTTRGTFVIDQLKALLIQALLIPPMLILLLKVIEWGGNSFYLYAWALYVVFSVAILLLAQSVIMPMFLTFTPLPDGQLRSSIERLAGALDFPLYKLFVIDGSKRSSHSNAFFMGFWKWKRICLFDTLLEQCTDEEVLAIMGHELGHWKLGHNTRMMVVGYISAFVNFFLFGFVMNETRLYTDFGFTASQQCVFLGLFLFAQVYQPVSTIVSRYTTARTRAHEFEADSFAVACGLNEDLASGLLAIHHSNLASPTSDPWYSAWHHSHPPLDERLRAIKHTPASWIRKAAAGVASKLRSTSE